MTSQFLWFSYPCIFSILCSKQGLTYFVQESTIIWWSYLLRICFPNYVNCWITTTSNLVSVYVCPTNVEYNQKKLRATLCIRNIALHLFLEKCIRNNNWAHAMQSCWNICNCEQGEEVWAKATPPEFDQVLLGAMSYWLLLGKFWGHWWLSRVDHRVGRWEEDGCRRNSSSATKGKRGLIEVDMAWCDDAAS
jgi:hypothetical protein